MDVTRENQSINHTGFTISRFSEQVRVLADIIIINKERCYK